MSNKVRLIVGEGDRVLRGPHQEHLQAVTGRTCPPGSSSCFSQDGSGWAIVPNSECEGNCKHEYLDTRNFLEPSRWWGVEENLDWLENFVHHSTSTPTPVPTPIATPTHPPYLPLNLYQRPHRNIFRLKISLTPSMLKSCVKLWVLSNRPEALLKKILSSENQADV